MPILNRIDPVGISMEVNWPSLGLIEHTTEEFSVASHRSDVVWRIFTATLSLEQLGEFFQRDLPRTIHVMIKERQDRPHLHNVYIFTDSKLLPGPVTPRNAKRDEKPWLPRRAISPHLIMLRTLRTSLGRSTPFIRVMTLKVVENAHSLLERPKHCLHLQ